MAGFASGWHEPPLAPATMTCTCVQIRPRSHPRWPSRIERCTNVHIWIELAWVNADTAIGMHDQASRPPWATSIRQRRKALGLRQVELAELASCSTRFVHTLEAGKSTLRLDKVLIVLGVLGLGFRLAAGRGITLDGGLSERP